MFLEEATNEGLNGEAIYTAKDGSTHSVFHQPDGSYYYRWYTPFKGGYTAKTLEELQVFLDTLKVSKPHLPSNEWMPRIDWEREDLREIQARKREYQKF